ncbi:hypothetical protein HYV87_01135 [Candidatus Woesearchaeota archaeon]|nr:hypothetical protein [Candidatus Woesearchaeota archaeon]
MNNDQAYQISNYTVVPRDRTTNIEVIRVMGYTRLRGGRLLSDCPDQQLYRVAQRLSEKARTVLDQELQAELQEMHDEEDIITFHNQLCDLDNIPEEERENHTIDELVRRFHWS